jgi:hypothetical protein
MVYDGINDRYLSIALNIVNGGYTPPVKGCNVTLRRHDKTFAWYLKDTEILLPRNSQSPKFQQFKVERTALYNALRKITLG